MQSKPVNDPVFTLPKIIEQMKKAGYRAGKTKWLDDVGRVEEEFDAINTPYLFLRNALVNKHTHFILPLMQLLDFKEMLPHLGDLPQESIRLFFQSFQQLHPEVTVVQHAIDTKDPTVLALVSQYSDQLTAEDQLATNNAIRQALSLELSQYLSENISRIPESHYHEWIQLFLKNDIPIPAPLMIHTIRSENIQDIKLLLTQRQDERTDEAIWAAWPDITSSPEILSLLLQAISKPAANVERLTINITNALFEAIHDNKPQAIQALLQYKQFINRDSTYSGQRIQRVAKDRSPRYTLNAGTAPGAVGDNLMMAFMAMKNQNTVQTYFPAMLALGADLGAKTVAGLTVFSCYDRYPEAILQALMTQFCHQRGIMDISLWEAPNLSETLGIIGHPRVDALNNLSAITLYLACNPAVGAVTYRDENRTLLNAALSRGRLDVCATLRERGHRFQPADILIGMKQKMLRLNKDFLAAYLTDTKGENIQPYLLLAINTAATNKNLPQFKQLLAVIADGKMDTLDNLSNSFILQNSAQFDASTVFAALVRAIQSKPMGSLQPQELANLLQLQPALENRIVRAFIAQNPIMQRSNYWQARIAQIDRVLTLQDVLDHVRGMHQKPASTLSRIFPYYSGTGTLSTLGNSLSPEVMETKPNDENKVTLLKYMVSQIPSLENIPEVVRPLPEHGNPASTPTFADLQNTMKKHGITINWDAKVFLWTKGTISLKSYILDMRLKDPTKYRAICAADGDTATVMIQKLKDALSTNRSHFFAREKTTGTKVFEEIEPTITPKTPGK